MQWWAGHGDQRGLAGLYLCLEGCRPAHSQRSSTCVPQGSPGHRCSGWGRQQLCSGHASVGRAQVWLEGRLRVWHAASLPPLPTTLLQCNGAADPWGCPRASSAWHGGGSPGHLTWLSQHAVGAAAAGAALLPRVACGVVVTSCPTAWPNGTASTGAVSRALCRGRCSMQPCSHVPGSRDCSRGTKTGTSPHPTHCSILVLASLGVSSSTCGGQEAGPDLPNLAALLSTRAAMVGEAVQAGGPGGFARPHRALTHFGWGRRGSGGPVSRQGPVWGCSEGEGSALVPGAVLLGQGEQCQEHQKKGVLAQHCAAVNVLLGNALGFKPCWSGGWPSQAAPSHGSRVPGLWECWA